MGNETNQSHVGLVGEIPPHDCSVDILAVDDYSCLPLCRQSICLDPLPLHEKEMKEWLNGSAGKPLTNLSRGRRINVAAQPNKAVRQHGRAAYSSPAAATNYLSRRWYK